MSTTTAGIIFGTALILALGFTYRPLGDYLARTYSGGRHLRAEKAIYRVAGIDPEAEQTWGGYLRSVLAFSGVSVLFLYIFLRVQHHIGLGHAYAVPKMGSAQAFNTAASFVTNTNWQSYSGESALGYVVQATGLAVQNFASAAVGIAVAVALIRGFVRSRTGELGNFWVDLTRTCIRVLLPTCTLMAIVFIAGGEIQNWHHYTTATTLNGSTQTLPGGPVASQEAIKQFGTNGGGFFNANSAHPFENPTAWTDWFQIYLLLAIPIALPRTFGKMVGDVRQGRAIVAVMGVLLVISTALVGLAQTTHHGTVPTAVGASTEGVETRFGVADSSIFAAATTATSTGAVN